MVEGIKETININSKCLRITVIKQNEWPIPFRHGEKVKAKAPKTQDLASYLGTWVLSQSYLQYSIHFMSTQTTRSQGKCHFLVKIK